MTGHVYHAGMDREYPASLSFEISTNLLRHQLGWQGVIFTDDLDMKALTRQYGVEERIRLAVRAGADILIFSGNARGMDFDPDFPRLAHETLLRLVRERKIPKERLRSSWERITELKKRHKKQGAAAP